MIKHIVLFRFREDVSATRRAELLAEYSGFPKIYPSMKTFDIGWNRSERDTRFDVGFVIEFETETQLKAYLNSGTHEKHVSERFRPMIAERAIVSFEYDPGSHAMVPGGPPVR